MNENWIKLFCKCAFIISSVITYFRKNMKYSIFCDIKTDKLPNGHIIGSVIETRT